MTKSEKYSKLLQEKNLRGDTKSKITYHPQFDIITYDVGDTEHSSVIIPRGVDYISRYAFAEYDKIKDVFISEGVIDIDEFAFVNSGIDKVILPKSLKRIQMCAFRESALSSIDLKNVEFLGESCFQHCYNLTELTIPETCKFIGDNLVEACDELQRLTFNCNLTNYRGVTANCRNLEEIIFNGNIDFIDNRAFILSIPVNEISLNRLIFRGNIGCIQRGTFYDTKTIRTIIVSRDVDVNVLKLGLLDMDSAQYRKDITILREEPEYSILEMVRLF